MCIKVCEYFLGSSSSAALTITASQDSPIANVFVQMIVGPSLTGVNTSAEKGVCPIVQVTKYRLSFHVAGPVLKEDMNRLQQKIDEVISAWLPHAQMR